MRWTAENEAKLLRVLPETQTLVIDASKIVQGWDDEENIPTTKAIKDHLGILQKNHKPDASLTIRTGTGGLASPPRKKRKSTASTADNQEGEQPMPKRKRKRATKPPKNVNDEDFNVSDF